MAKEFKSKKETKKAKTNTTKDKTPKYLKDYKHDAPLSK